MPAIASLTVCLGLAVVCQSRAFSLGYLIAICIIAFGDDAFKKNIRIKKIAVVGLILITVLAFFIKLNSSLGRLLIYKVDWSMLRDHYLKGVGTGNYGVVYARYQAQYFRAGHYTEKELLLADNVRYAFNDYLQFIIETGILGVLLILLLLYCITVLSFKAIRNQNGKFYPLILFFTGHVISFCIAALFRPVFYKIFLLVIFLICLMTVVSYFTFKNGRFIKSLVLNACVAGSVLLFYYKDHIKFYRSYERFGEAKDIYDAGYLNESCQVFDSLYSDLKEDYVFLDDYSAVLIRAGEYDKAILVLKEVMKMSSNISLHIRLADCLYKKGNIKEAERLYLNAIYTVPNRFNSRFCLYNFYRNTNQEGKAFETGKRILELPVKVPSFQVEHIRQTIRQELEMSGG